MFESQSEMRSRLFADQINVTEIAMIVSALEDPADVPDRVLAVLCALYASQVQN